MQKPGPQGGPGERKYTLLECLRVCGTSRRHASPDEYGLAATKRASGFRPASVGHLDKDGFLYLADRKSYLIISGGWYASVADRGVRCAGRDGRKRHLRDNVAQKAVAKGIGAFFPSPLVGEGAFAEREGG
jgi:hypothetical protein